MTLSSTGPIDEFKSAIFYKSLLKHSNTNNYNQFIYKRFLWFTSDEYVQKYKINTVWFLWNVCALWIAILTKRFPFLSCYGLETMVPTLPLVSCIWSQYNYMLTIYMQSGPPRTLLTLFCWCLLWLKVLDYLLWYHGAAIKKRIIILWCAGFMGLFGVWSRAYARPVRRAGVIAVILGSAGFPRVLYSHHQTDSTYIQ
jgi:hypothetical protein